MKKILLMCVTMLVALPQAFAGKPLSIKDITGNVFSAKTISGINPLKGTSEFAQISSDEKKLSNTHSRQGERLVFSLTCQIQKVLYSVSLMTMTFPMTDNLFSYRLIRKEFTAVPLRQISICTT